MANVAVGPKERNTKEDVRRVAPSGAELRRQQRIVIWSIVLAFPVTALLGLFFDRVLPATSTDGALVDRIALALRCDVPVVLTMVVGVQVIANIRLRTPAIDPIAYVESRGSSCTRATSRTLTSS